MDTALRELETLITQLGSFLQNHYNEADTRVKFIDPLLTNVLGWKEHIHIRREENFQSEAGKRCIDYTVSLNEPSLVVEAKQTLVDFGIPTTTDKHIYSLDGVIRDWPNAWAAIKQAREYCDKIGARYALVTNGHQYIAFKALSEHGRWDKGHALVLGSTERLKQHFTLFYECLSKETIAKDKLSDIAHQSPAPTFREKARSKIHLPNSGFRNSLFDALHGIFSEILLDTADPTPEFLEECYCKSDDAKKHGIQLSSIVDSIPFFRTPIQPIRPGHQKDPFETTLKQATPSNKNQPLVIVMGGAGVGKTTFLNWYFKTHIPKESADKSYVARLDFRDIECEPEQVHDLTIRKIIETLEEVASDVTSTYDQIKQIFHRPINEALRGILRPWAGNPDEIEKKIAEHLEKILIYDIRHLQYFVAYLREHCTRNVIVILDNMDQKSDKLQERLYHTAHEISRTTNSVVILSARESTYYYLTKAPKETLSPTLIST